MSDDGLFDEPCAFCGGTGWNKRMAEPTRCDRCTYAELLPETPVRFLSRTNSPDTSKSAAASIKITELEHKVLVAIRAFGAAGCIQDELLDANPGLAYSSITSRPSGLKRKGLIVDTGDRRKGHSGRNQAVLVAVEFLDEYLRLHKGDAS